MVVTSITVPGDPPPPAARLAGPSTDPRPLIRGFTPATRPIAVPVIEIEDFRKTYTSGEVQVHAVHGDLAERSIPAGLYRHHGPPRFGQNTMMVPRSDASTGLRVESSCSTA